MLKNISRSTFLHPILFSIFPIIFLYSQNVHIASFRGFVIPLLLSLFITLLLLIVVRYILKNKNKSALVVSLFVFLFLIFGHFKNLLSNYEEVFIVTDNHILILFLILVIGCSLYFLKTKRNLDNATIITNSIAAVLVVMVLVNIGTYNLENIFSDESINNTQTLVAAETLAHPDVYFILLDGYANQVVMQKFFDYDNQKFFDSLTEQGFFVPNKYTNSNYPLTQLSVPSILNMNYIDSFVSSETPDNHRVEMLYKLIDSNTVMQNFKKLGYKNISFDSGWFGTRAVAIADENLCENSNVDWRVLDKLKGTTILPAIKTLNEIIREQIHEQKRQRISCEFSEFPSVTENFKEPVFVFAHIVAPHPPWVFDSNGDPQIPYVYVNTKDVKKRQNAYISQLEFINKKVIESTKKLISESNKEAIIIILSDHGTRILNDDATDHQKNIIKLGNFMAFYLPNNIETSDYETSPVNVFRLIFNSYFNGNYKILEDKVFKNSHVEYKNWEERVNNALP